MFWKKKAPDPDLIQIYRSVEMLKAKVESLESQISSVRQMKYRVARKETEGSEEPTKLSPEEMDFIRGLPAHEQQLAMARLGIKQNYNNEGD